jgi:hypothetical protein
MEVWHVGLLILRLISMHLVLELVHEVLFVRCMHRT